MNRYAVCMSLSHFSSYFCPFCMTISVSSLTQSDCSTTMCDFFFVFASSCHSHVLWTSNHSHLHVLSWSLASPYFWTSPENLEFQWQKGHQHAGNTYQWSSFLLSYYHAQEPWNVPTILQQLQVWVVCDARYARSAGRKIDTRTSASASSSEIRFFSFLISAFISNNHQHLFLHNRSPKEVLFRSIIWIRCSKCLCSIAHLGMTILIWYPTCLVFNWLSELQQFFINTGVHAQSSLSFCVYLCCWYNDLPSAWHSETSVLQQQTTDELR